MSRDPVDEFIRQNAVQTIGKLIPQTIAKLSKPDTSPEFIIAKYTEELTAQLQLAAPMETVRFCAADHPKQYSLFEWLVHLLAAPKLGQEALLPDLQSKLLQGMILASRDSTAGDEKQKDEKVAQLLNLTDEKENSVGHMLAQHKLFHLFPLFEQHGGNLHQENRTNDAPLDYLCHRHMQEMRLATQVFERGTEAQKTKLLPRYIEQCEKFDGFIENYFHHENEAVESQTMFDPHSPALRISSYVAARVQWIESHIAKLGVMDTELKQASGAQIQDYIYALHETLRDRGEHIKETILLLLQMEVKQILCPDVLQETDGYRKWSQETGLSLRTVGDAMCLCFQDIPVHRFSIPLRVAAQIEMPESKEEAPPLAPQILNLAMNTLLRQRGKKELEPDKADQERIDNYHQLYEKSLRYLRDPNTNSLVQLHLFNLALHEEVIQLDSKNPAEDKKPHHRVRAMFDFLEKSRTVRFSEGVEYSEGYRKACKEARENLVGAFLYLAGEIQNRLAASPTTTARDRGRVGELIHAVEGNKEMYLSEARISEATEPKPKAPRRTRERVPEKPFTQSKRTAPPMSIAATVEEVAAKQDAVKAAIQAVLGAVHAHIDEQQCKEQKAASEQPASPQHPSPLQEPSPPPARSTRLNPRATPFVPQTAHPIPTIPAEMQAQLIYAQQSVIRALMEQRAPSLGITEEALRSNAEEQCKSLGSIEARKAWINRLAQENATRSFL